MRWDAGGSPASFHARAREKRLRRNGGDETLSRSLQKKTPRAPFAKKQYRIQPSHSRTLQNVYSKRMKLVDLQNKKIVVVGRGIEGTSAIRFLKRFAPGAIINTTDATDGPEYLKKQIGFDYAIRSPGVPKRFITIPCTTPTNIFFGNTRGI